MRLGSSANELSPAFIPWIVLATLVTPSSVEALAARQDRTTSASDDPGASVTSYYEEGLRLRELGRWDEALDVWEEAWDELAAAGVRDPRIGLGYVELATERQATDRYATASELLLWSLSGRPVDGARDALLEELDRVLLLVDGDERRELEGLAGEDDRELLLGLKRFWLERDPTPATDLNERLIEHWRRIAIARNRYTHNRSSPIDTDDRGVIYLKFGEAERTRSGTLGASEHELMIRAPRDAAGRESLRRYDPNPQYEVWVYERLNERDLTYFLFGNTDGTGPFELVDGVHELISPAAQARSSARYTPGGIPASYYLELFYYQDLSHMGGHFGRRFAELDQVWNLYTARRNSYLSSGRQAPREGELDARNVRWEQEDTYLPPSAPAVAVRSEFEGRARDELVAQLIRTLSDDNVPVLVLVGASAPRLGAATRDAFEQRLELPGWAMRHTLIIRDRELDEVGRLAQAVSNEQADVSFFVLRHVDQPLHLTLTARTLRDDGSADTLVASDRLPGQVHLRPDSPLTTDTARLEVSDLMTGTTVPPDLAASALPYDILPSRRIWRQDPLRVYLEMYHLGQEAGSAHLEALFRILPLDESGEVDDEREVISLDFTAEPVGSTYREFFDIALRDQRPGRYRLEVEITDRVRNQSVLRQVVVELVD